MMEPDERPLPTRRAGLEARLRNIVSSFDARLLRPGTGHRLACLRSALAAVIAFRLLVSPWWEMAGRPAPLFRPVTFLAWLDTVPPAAVLVSLELIGVAAAGLAVVGIRQRTSLTVAWCGLLILGGLHSSAGKVMHNEVLLLLAVVPLLVATSAGRLGERARSVAFGWPPRAVLGVIAVVYFLTGLQKLRHSGLSWVLGDNMQWVLVAGAGSDRSLWPDFAMTMANTWLVPHLLAFGAITLELTAPLWLAFWRTRLLFAVAATTMHATIGIAMGLDYSAWVLTVWAAVLPWDWLRDRRRRSAPSVTGGTQER